METTPALRSTAETGPSTRHQLSEKNSPANAGDKKSWPSAFCSRAPRAAPSKAGAPAQVSPASLMAAT